ncbi:DUF2844 domain-containing protein [Neisseriaceae bacterium TC5R-5]|nr:DUF2844 domain-containing protein [Neisseriaceae bacterium TC5R-5]
MKKNICGLGVLFAVVLTSNAQASLGQYIAPNGETIRSFSVLKTVEMAGYSIQESQDAAGMLIREFVSSEGIVFAVSWRGKTIPNMQRLLGEYFPVYAQAQRNNRAGLNMLQGVQSGLEVSSGGRMGAFYGVAYVSGLLPAGLTMDQFQ